MIIGRRTILIAVALALCGCDGNRWAWPKPKPSAPPQKDAREEELSALKAKNDELRARCEQLTNRANQLDFLNEQLTRQLEIVGDAPRQRDQYKARLADLQRENDRLYRLIDVLQHVEPGPGARTQPASAPASAPSGAGIELGP